MNINHIEQASSVNQTIVLLGKSRVSANMCLHEMAGEVLNQTVVHLINFSAGRKCSTSKLSLR